MNSLNRQTKSRENSNTTVKECWWMQGGVVDYKLCDRDYDCEHCPFDEVFHRPLIGSAPSGFQEGVTNVKHRDSAPDSPKVHGWDVVDGLFYHPSHTWARIEDGGCVRTGLDDFAQHILGRSYSLTGAQPGVDLHYGEPCWRFTHQSGVAVFVAPVSGKVKQINRALGQRPALLNRDPYGDGWVLLIEPTDLKGCLKRLLYGPRVTQWYESEFARLYDKVSEVAGNEPIQVGRTLNDGGWLDKDFIKALSADGRRQLIEYFFPISPIDKAEKNKAILVK